MTWTGSPIANGYEFTHNPSGARIIFDYIQQNKWGGLSAWMELRSSNGGTPYAYGRQDLLGPQAGEKLVAKASKADDSIPWAEGVNESVYEVVQNDRLGATIIDLATWEAQPTQWILEPLIERGGHTRLIAPGDSGKSYYALAACLAVTTGSAKFIGVKPKVTGPVIYLDWETDADTHARRRDALLKAVDHPPINRDQLIYMEMDSPLWRVAHQIHRAVDTYQAVLVVLDSTMLARGAGGDRAEDSSIRLFSELRGFSVPAFMIDHKAKEDIKKGKRGGYGSVVNQNSVRLEWEMTRITPLGQNRKAFTLSLEKHNNTGQKPPMSYQFTVDERGALFERVDGDKLAAVDDQDLGDRMVYLLSGSDEPLTVKRISEMLGAKQSSVRSRLNSDGRFENRSSSGAGRWMVSAEFRDEGEQDELDLSVEDAEFLDDDGVIW